MSNSCRDFEAMLQARSDKADAYIRECRVAFRKPMNDMIERGMELGLSPQVIAIVIGAVAIRCAALAAVGGGLEDNIFGDFVENEARQIRRMRAAGERPLS